MIHPDDPLGLDSRRLARWKPPLPPRGPRRRSLPAPRDVIAAHGGELPFWLAWLRGELDAELQDWFRRHAEDDAALRQDLHAIEQPHGTSYSTRTARAEVRDALEAGNYLTETNGNESSPLPLLLAAQQDDLPTETDLVLTRRPEAERKASQGELRRRLRSGLFALLEEVEVRVPPAEEAAEGTRLLEHLVGLAAVTRFLRLHQLRDEPRPPLRDRLLRALAPELFARSGEGWRHRLSFRLFVRARLQHHCRRHGWLPGGPRYRDLASAFAALGRERIGQLLRGIVAADDVFAPAGVPCRQLGVLLEAVP